MSHERATKKPAPQDWHRAQIVCALRMAGWSLRRLSAHHGYYPTTLKHALDGPYLNGERIIAAAIGVDPAEIWPSRYVRKRTRRASKSHREAA